MSDRADYTLPDADVSFGQDHGATGSVDHISLVYEDRDEQLSRAAHFIRQGLEQDERCLYLVDDNTIEAVAGALREAGIDIADACNSGALSLQTGADAYLRAGDFDPGKMIDFWESSLEQAREQAEFEGIRAAAEMTWAIDSDTNLDALLRYETLLNSVYADEDYTVLCQYNRNRFPADVISSVVRSHPHVIQDTTAHQTAGCRPSVGCLDSDDLCQINGVTEANMDPARQTSLPASGSTIQSRVSGPVRVLYVDDTPGYADMVAEYLHREGEFDVVVTETDPHDALDRLDNESIDCVVSDYDMHDIDGLELLELVRERRPDMPFILVTGKGDEEVASKAISTGVTDYFRKERNVEQYAVLANRISNAVEQHRREREIRRTQRQYRRLVESSTDVITVLDEGGRCRYVSPAAERRLGYRAEELIGESAFDHVHPEDRETVAEQFSKLVTRPDGTTVTEFRFVRPDGSWMWLEARWRNLLGDPDIGGIIMYARDVTDRKEREQALQESEERFRSIFQKAFDGMVIANDAGEYIDANPAACDLFGLSREELLGRSIAEFAPDDYDFEAAWQQFRNSDQERGTFPLVGADGTERVVEFAATPDIVPGHHLSILRDVTDREQYEQALTALHEASRDLLAAESDIEVAECVVQATTELLSMSTVVVYLFESDEGRLRPRAVSKDTVDPDSLEGIVPDRNRLVGSVFLEEEPRRIDATDDTNGISDLPLQSGYLFPLGSHGVCVIGDTDSRVTDEETELAEILTATAETALDRVDKERELRDRQAELREQNQQLERLNEINTTIREIDRALAQADTRTEIEAAVCTHLSECRGVASVWIGEQDSNRLTPREWDGDDGIECYIDSVPLSLDDDTRTPATRVAGTTETMVENIADELHRASWRKTALSHGYQSVFSTSLTYKHISYGIMSVYADEPSFFREVSRTALEDLSNKVANAINAVEHQNAVLAESITEVKFRLTGEGLPLNAVAARLDCSLTLETITQSSASVTKFLSVKGAAPTTVTDSAADLAAISDASVVTDDGQEGLVSVRYLGKPLAVTLADRGVRVPEFNVDAGSATITLLVPDTVGIDWIFEKFEARDLRPELVAKTERERSDTTAGQRAVESFRSKLTPRQEEVLRTAYLSGFFQSPRECTGEDLADYLDVSSQTVYRHIRAAERKLFETVFSDGVNSNPPARN